MEGGIGIGAYLIQQLYDSGVRHVFGVPGDYALGFYDQLVASPLRVVTTCDEQAAGFAADAYARVSGLGVVCVTYCVGGLKVANPTAEAYAEKSPVVIISGAPGIRERHHNPLLHHKVRDFDTQRRVFEQLTVASTVLNDPQTALHEIDRVLHAARRYKRPVYIELPRDMVQATAPPYHTPLERDDASDPRALRAAVADAVAMIEAAERPVILADAEIHRFGLQPALLQLVQQTNFPVATTLLGKSVVGESNAAYVGIYEGAMGHEPLTRYVEASDCVVMLGVFMSDINLGIFTAQLDPARCISATSEKLSIGYRSYDDVRLEDFLQGLLGAGLRPRPAAALPRPHPTATDPPADGKITMARLMQRLDAFLTPRTIVIADVGDALFGSADLCIYGSTEFLSPAYYTSMGFAVPAAIGAQLANPALRPLVIVGDGGFQMTGMELSGVVRLGLNPVVIVLNNGGYTTERFLAEGPYNDILPWNYSRLPDVLGAGRGFVVETERDLEAALQAAEQHTDSFCLLDVHLDKLDGSPALRRLTERLQQRL